MLAILAHPDQFICEFFQSIIIVWFNDVVMVIQLLQVNSLLYHIRVFGETFVVFLVVDIVNI